MVRQRNRCTDAGFEVSTLRRLSEAGAALLRTPEPRQPSVFRRVPTGQTGSSFAPHDDESQAIRDLASRCQRLEAVRVEEIEQALGSLPHRSDCEREAQRRSFVAWLLTTGRTELAHDWASSGQASSGLVPDAQLSLLQVQAAIGRRPLATAARFDTATDVSATIWYQLLIEFYWHLIDGEFDRGGAVLEHLRERGDRSSPSLRPLVVAMDALCEAVDGCGEEIDLAPPARPPSLFDLAPILISAEAVVLRGTQETAARWSHWFDQNWPAHVFRACAWPVLVHRIRALLAARAGDLGAALDWIDEAIALADRIDSPVEAALGRVQAAELVATDPQPGSRERWRALVQDGRERCRALGIPDEHHARRARIAAAGGRFDLLAAEQTSVGLDSGLTPREVEVLRLFSAGHSYRQTADILGVGWRTVQSHAYNAYQKLGVSSKIAAISAASRRQLL